MFVWAWRVVHGVLHVGLNFAVVAFFTRFAIVGGFPSYAVLVEMRIVNCSDFLRFVVIFAQSKKGKLSLNLEVEFHLLCR